MMPVVALQIEQPLAALGMAMGGARVKRRDVSPISPLQWGCAWVRLTI